MSNEKAVRFTYCTGFILIVFLLGMAFYLELIGGVIPCPLCLLQRIVMSVLGVLFFIGLVFRWKRRGNLFIEILGLIISFIGIMLSGRQVWMQHIPQEGLGECGISLLYMFKIFSFPEAIQHIWRGGTECTQLNWVFMHLSLAEWTLIWFGLFFILLLLQHRRIMAMV